MKTFGGVKVLLHIFLTLAGKLYTLATLPAEKVPLVSTGEEAGWAQSPSGGCREERNLMSLLGIELQFHGLPGSSLSLTH
jgi:hypothetical protein